MKTLVKRSLIAVTLMLFALHTQAATITFDTTPGAGNPTIGTHAEAGYSVSSSHAHIIGDIGICSFSGCISSNSGQYAASEMGPLGGAITIAHAGGSAFNLFKFDGGENFMDDAAAAAGSFPNAGAIRVVGAKMGGGSITAILGLDGFKDGPGGTNDLQTFLLSGFTDLSSVTFVGLLPGSSTAFGAFSLDNIEVSAVPEPESVVLFLFGLGSLALIRRRKNKNKLTV